MKMWKILFCMGWLGCSVINYGFLYGAFRHLEVNEWHLATEFDPSLHRTDCVIAGAFAITGPLGIGGDIVAQAWSGFPGWHVTDWDQMKDGSRIADASPRQSTTFFVNYPAYSIVYIQNPVVIEDGEILDCHHSTFEAVADIPAYMVFLGDGSVTDCNFRSDFGFKVGAVISYVLSDAAQKNAIVYKQGISPACRAHAARKKRKRTKKYIFRSWHIERYLDTRSDGAKR